MLPLHLVLATAVAAWRPPMLPPEPQEEPAVQASPAPVEAPPAPPPASPPPAAVPQVADAVRTLPLIARAPLDLRVRPAPVASRTPLYKDWRFWAVAGGLFAATVATTYVVTQPDPPPYTGNAHPYYVTFR